MKHIQKTLYFLGSLWEIGRFFLLFLIISLLINPAGNPVMNLLLLWLSAGQLCGGVSFFLLGYFPERFAVLRGILALYKFIGILPALIFVMTGILLPKTLSSGSPASLGLVLPGVVVFVDFLFLVYLVLYSPGTGPDYERQAGETETLPDFQETRVEEK